MDRTGIILAVFVSAAITFVLRALPFAAFRNGREMPEKLIYLGGLLPSAIMSVLIVYCLKTVVSDFGEQGIPQLAAVLLVTVSYKWKHNTLLSIVLGTACHMLLLHVI